ncbi:MAG: hypothetical protein M3458_20855 [Acidobacteriota bacterium]|nr:hypothetical protein [Acidobacteriota bacterium]
MFIATAKNRSNKGSIAKPMTEGLGSTGGLVRAASRLCELVRPEVAVTPPPKV